MGWNSDKTKKATEYTMFGNDMHSAKKVIRGSLCEMLELRGC